MNMTRVIFISLFISLTACGENPSRSPKTDTVVANIDVQWPKSRSTIVVPLQYTDSRPLIICNLNGKPAVFLVDTGAAHLCLFQDSLKKYGIENLGEKNITITGAGATKRSVWSGSFTLTIQDVLPIKVSSAICLPATAKGNYENIDGILSCSLMKALNCTIDLKSEKITFSRDAQPNNVSKNKPNQGMDPTSANAQSVVSED